MLMELKIQPVSIWNGVKSAIVTPIEEAKNKVKSVRFDAIKASFQVV